jgi:hypothetical protein
LTREPGEDDDDETPAVDLVALAEAERELADRTKREQDAGMTP